MAGNFKFRFIWYLIYHYKIIGRVVNLFESENPEEKVFGVAYEIDQETWNSQVMAHLDDREKGGYSQHAIRFYPREPIEGIELKGHSGLFLYSRSCKNLF